MVIPFNFVLREGLAADCSTEWNYNLAPKVFNELGSSPLFTGIDGAVSGGWSSWPTSQLNYADRESDNSAEGLSAHCGLILLNEFRHTNAGPIVFEAIA